MKRFRRILKAAIYLPILPRNLKSIVRFLRFVGWLQPTPVSFGEIRRILIVQPHNSLGDLVLSFPFLDEVHRQWPEARIDLVVGSAMTVLFRDIPLIRRVIGYTPSLGRRPLARYRDTLRLLWLYRHEVTNDYDLALDPRWDSDGFAYLARAMAFLSGASLRASYSGHVDGYDPSLDEFMTHRALGGCHEHESIRKLRMLQRAGLSSRVVETSEQFQVSETLSAAAELGKSTGESLLETVGIHPSERYVILAPSASSARRIWPIDYLATVVRSLSAKYDMQFLVIGTAREAEICDRVAAMNPRIVKSLAGKTNPIEMLAIIAGAALFIGNDSGPGHISGMLGRNTVTISLFPVSSNGLDHANAPSRFSPCGPRTRIVQPDHPLFPCDPTCGKIEAHCIKQVSADDVLAACEDLLLANNWESCQSELAGGI